MEENTPNKNRINVVLSDSVHSDLTYLAKSTGRTMTEVIRIGLGLAKLAIEAEKSGNKLLISTGSLMPIKEIVIPG